MAKINSRAKGAAGEREAAKALESLGFGACRRGCQHSGGPDSPDVITETPGIHFEVKRVERLNIDAAMDQSVRDAGADEVPVVMHRKNRRPWLVTMRLEDFARYVTPQNK